MTKEDALQAVAEATHRNDVALPPLAPSHPALTCGCYDGAYGDGEEEPVAIRCPRHAHVPALIVGAAVRRVAEVRVDRLLPATHAPSRRRPTAGPGTVETPRPRRRRR